MKPRMRSNGRAPEIVRLAVEEQLNTKQIATRVGCSIPNVYRTLVRYGITPRPVKFRVHTTRIAILSNEHRNWLMKEARRMRADWRDLARAMLIDAIKEARNVNG